MKHVGCLVEWDILPVAQMGTLNASGPPTQDPLIDNSSMRTDEAILGKNLYLSNRILI